MISLLFLFPLLQEPTTQPPPSPAPEATPVDPAATPRQRSREDRLEGRVASDPATAPVVETPAPEPPAKLPFADWLSLNRCALIVNEELITMFEIQRGVQRRIRDQKRTSVDEKQLQEMLGKEVSDRAAFMLQIQGGKDLGFDTERVDRIVEDYLEVQTERAGGVTLLAQDLKRDDKDSFARRDEIYAYVYSKLWAESVTGTAQGPGGRMVRDRFVRPGRALFEYREDVKNQPKTRSVETTQLLLILETPPAPGAAERIVRRLESLRERVVEGEDMGELAELGATEKGRRGRSPFLNLKNLRRGNPEIAAFLETAKVGELSPVLPFQFEGKLVGYVVVRPEEYRVAAIEGFAEPRQQLARMQAEQKHLDELRIQRGLADLVSAAYVWPPQNFAAKADEP